MITDEKPPLDDALLMHFGIPGMKWGHRKSKRSAAEPRTPLSTTQKVALGSAAVLGTAALLYNGTTRGYALGAVKKTVSLGRSATGKVLRTSGRVTVSAVRKAGGAAGDALGVTGAKAAPIIEVKPKRLDRIKASLARGKALLFDDPEQRTALEQAPDWMMVPVSLTTDALF